MKFFKPIHVVLYFILIPLYTLIGALLLFCLFPFFQRRRYVDWLMQAWIRLLLWTCGVKVTVEGQENLDPDQLYLYVANHQSQYDIPALFVAIKARLRMLAKKELFRIPIFGWGMWAVGHIVVDRENREKAIKSVDKAVKRLQTEDISVVVFPEGTRSPDGKIHKFKKGAFVMAIQSGRPVIPITILGSKAIMPKKSLIIRGGRIHVKIGKPIPTEGMEQKDRGELAQMCEDVVRETFGDGSFL